MRLFRHLVLALAFVLGVAVRRHHAHRAGRRGARLPAQRGGARSLHRLWRRRRQPPVGHAGDGRSRPDHHSDPRRYSGFLACDRGRRLDRAPPAARTAGGSSAMPRDSAAAAINRWPLVIAILIVALTALVLHLMGRHTICVCGTIKLWHAAARRELGEFAAPDRLVLVLAQDPARLHLLRLAVVAEAGGASPPASFRRSRSRPAGRSPKIRRSSSTAIGRRRSRSTTTATRSSTR